ncbi:13344_t:CDS:2, partial [Funneliformis geosporum]
LKKNTKEPVIEALNDGDNGKIQKPAPVVKRDRKKKEPIIEALNDTPINQKENNEVRSDDEYIDGNDSKDDDVNELLETNDSYLSEDVISVKHKPLALITNNMHINKLCNNSLNNSNEATDRTLNYNSHLINTPCYTTPHSSARSTNTCLSTPIPCSLCSTDTHLSITYNVHPFTPRTLHSTNTRLFTSHSNNTNFNDNVF